MFLKNEFFDSPGILGCKNLNDWKKELFIRYPYLQSQSGKVNHTPDEEFHNSVRAYSKFPETKSYDINFLYTHNEYGFRDSELSSKVDACYYGCSITYGFGVPKEARWTAVVDKEFDFTSNNFGVLGTGPEELLNLFISSLQFVNMKYAIFLFPDMYRCTMPIQSPLGIHYEQLHRNYREKEKEYRALDKFEVAENFNKLPSTYFYDKSRNYKEMISYIGALNNIQVYFGTWVKHVPVYLNNAPDYVGKLINDKRGKDLSHPGITAHKNFANLVIERINKDKGEKL